jgi:predicted small secreted protein
MKRIWGGAAVLAVAALLLAGCTGGGAGSSVGSGGATVQSKPGQVSAGAPADPASKSDTVIAPNRDVVTTGSVSLTAADPIAAADRATALVLGAGGRIDNSSEQPATDTGKASATLVLRIPSSSLDATLADIKRLGTVDSATLNATDVTTQSNDIDGRITALQTSVDRLLALMAKATSTADLITIESTLSDRQAQLDSLVAQQKALADQVAMSTITVTIHARGTVVAAAPGTFWSGLTAGWNALVAAVNGLLIVVGTALPWLVVLGILGGIAWWIARRIGRKKGAAA